MASLSPSGGDLIDTTELDFISATINAVGFVTVANWQWAVVGPVDNGAANFEVTPSGTSITVEYVSETHLFPLQFIRYLDPERQAHDVTAWGDLPVPNESSIIFKMREDSKDLLEWSLSVTATGTDSQGSTVTASGTYVLRVYANYNTSRDLLAQALQER